MTKWTKRRRLAEHLLKAGFICCGAGAQWDAYAHEDLPDGRVFLGEKGQFRFGRRWTQSTNFGFFADMLLAGTHALSVSGGKIDFLRKEELVT